MWATTVRNDHLAKKHKTTKTCWICNKWKSATATADTTSSAYVVRFLKPGRVKNLFSPYKLCTLRLSLGIWLESGKLLKSPPKPHRRLKRHQLRLHSWQIFPHANRNGDKICSMLPNYNVSLGMCLIKVSYKENVEFGKRDLQISHVLPCSRTRLRYKDWLKIYNKPLRYLYKVVTQSNDLQNI